MSIKLLINNNEIWTVFEEYKKERLEKERTRLETASDPKDIYKIQGRIENIKEDLKLRETIREEERRKLESRKRQREAGPRGLR